MDSRMDGFRLLNSTLGRNNVKLEWSSNRIWLSNKERNRKIKTINGNRGADKNLALECWS